MEKLQKGLEPGAVASSSQFLDIQLWKKRTEELTRLLKQTIQYARVKDAALNRLKKENTRLLEENAELRRLQLPIKDNGLKSDSFLSDSETKIVPEESLGNVNRAPFPNGQLRKSEEEDSIQYRNDYYAALEENKKLSNELMVLRANLEKSQNELSEEQTQRDQLMKALSDQEAKLDQYQIEKSINLKEIENLEQQVERVTLKTENVVASEETDSQDGIPCLKTHESNSESLENGNQQHMQLINAEQRVEKYASDLEETRRALAMEMDQRIFLESEIEKLRITQEKNSFIFKQSQKKLVPQFKSIYEECESQKLLIKELKASIVTGERSLQYQSKDGSVAEIRLIYEELQRLKDLSTKLVEMMMGNT